MTILDFKINKFHKLQKIKVNGIRLVKYLFILAKKYIKNKYSKK